MTRLQDLFASCGQAPWLDTLSRDALEDGSLATLIGQGVRGVTSNFAHMSLKERIVSSMPYLNVNVSPMQIPLAAARPCAKIS